MPPTGSCSRDSETQLDPYSAGIDFSQILTTKVVPRTVRVKLFLMTVDP